MPNADNPGVPEWIGAIASFVGAPSEDVILLGHSLGVPAILRYLEFLPAGSSVGGVALVSGFIEPLEPENPRSDFRKIDSFVVPPINFDKIKNIPKQAVVLHGSEDKVVPFAHAEKISEGLGCKLMRVEGGDHFSQRTKPICYKLPEVLEVLLEMTI